jgi:molybdate transport system regulatory protein
MDTLTVAQAAKVLHLNPKRVQFLARTGRIPAVRVGRKWLIPRRELEGQLVRLTADAADSAQAIDLSARNQLRGRIAGLMVEGLMAEVRVAIGDQELVSVITRGAAERLHLKVGDEVYAVIKSTEVMIGKG